MMAWDALDLRLPLIRWISGSDHWGLVIAIVQVNYSTGVSLRLLLSWWIIVRDAVGLLLLL